MLCASVVGFGCAEATLRFKKRAIPALARYTGYPGLFWAHPAGVEIPTSFPVVEFEDYSARKPSRLDFRPGSYRFNSLGLREDDERPRPLLCVGDSTTLGLLVPAEETYCRRLGGLNAGVLGYNLEQIAVNAARLLPLVKPRTLVVGIYMNDAAPWPPRQRLWSFLETYSLFATSLRQLALELRPKPPVPAPVLNEASAAAIRRYDSMRSDFHGFAEALNMANDLAQWERAFPALERIKALCDAQGVELAAVVFPAQFQVNFGYDHPEPQRTIAARLEKLGVPYCDMAPAFRRHAEKAPLYPYLTDVAHFNGDGHRLAAECLASLLRRPARGRGAARASAAPRRYLSRSSAAISP